MEAPPLVPQEAEDLMTRLLNFNGMALHTYGFKHTVVAAAQLRDGQESLERLAQALQHDYGWDLIMAGCIRLPGPLHVQYIKSDIPWGDGAVDIVITGPTIFLAP